MTSTGDAADGSPSPLPLSASARSEVASGSGPAVGSAVGPAGGGGPAVVIPPGLGIREAASWLGQACWAELRLHEVLTHWLAVEADPVHIEVLWQERADAAERAEAWYRRLPELRELPRAELLAPSSPAVAALFDRLAELDVPDASIERRGALAAVLRGLRLGYHRHQEVAVGPADGPTARSLHTALRSTFGVGGADPSATWAAAVDAAGGLP